MNRAIYPILSGALAQERSLQVFSNNIANVNTPGYKQDQQGFKAILSRRVPGPAPVPGVNTIAQQIIARPGGANERVYTEPSFSRTTFEAGRTRNTSNPLDVAILGEGFFEVKTPQGLRYTRNGMFSLDNKRRLVTNTGLPVMGTKGEITVPSGTVAINAAGEIQVDGKAVGTIKVMEFKSQEMPAKSEGGLFAGGKGTVMANPMLQSGHIEESNVNSLGEMVKMIQGMRSYESAQRMIQTIDRMAEVAIQDVGRVL
jgi:flagellar basal-body rod protein FlgG